MKIVFVMRSLHVGGAERQLVELARGLNEAGHTVRVKLFYGNGALEPELREAGIPVEILEKRGRWEIVRFLARLVASLRAERPDIVHSYLPVSNIFVALARPALAGARVVWAIRASDMNRIPLDWPSRAGYGLEALLSPLPDLIVVNSQAGYDHGRVRGIAAKKMAVVPNGIDTDRFRFDAAGRARVRASLGLAEADTVVGTVGRIDPIKDLRTFVTAAAKVAPGPAFVLVGEGPDAARRELEALAARLGLPRLVFAGRRDDMPAVYSAIDILCSSSLSEGFPNVIAEAMACGCRCVVTDAGDSAEIVGPTGIVVPRGDAGALARGLQAMLARPREGRDEAARERIVTRFGKVALRERTEALLTRLVS